MALWKKVPIPEYEGLYEVSDEGEVRNLRSGRLLRPKQTKAGYYRVALANHGVVRSVSIHRLVALAFVDNPNGKQTVNHINEIKTDNRAENLEWATSCEQNIHGTRIERSVAHTNYKARRIDYSVVSAKHNYGSQEMCNRKRCKAYLNGVLFGMYSSQRAAAQSTGVCPAKVSECLRGKRKSCKGFVFKEIEEFPIAVTKVRFPEEVGK